jgi:hypothetical protein
MIEGCCPSGEVLLPCLTPHGLECRQDRNEQESARFIQIHYSGYRMANSKLTVRYNRESLSRNLLHFQTVFLYEEDLPFFCHFVVA